MIDYSHNVFILTTANTCYMFRVTKHGHLEHIHYGKRVSVDDADALAQKHNITLGSSVLYDQSDSTYLLDAMPLEWSDNGSGDFRYSPSEIINGAGGFSTDFTYRSHTISKCGAGAKTLPTAYDGSETLTIELKDTAEDLYLKLFYTVFEECDVITRRCELINRSDKPITIRRLLSSMVDIPNRGYDLVTLDGNWDKEAHRHARPVVDGMYVNSSTTGASSNRHNPAFALASKGANETTGEVFGFNLVYSGNHIGIVELSSNDTIRIANGINPHCFEWKLSGEESFETPESVLCYSDCGFGGLSERLHGFVRKHIVSGEWRDKERPVLINNWEAHFFKFTGGKLTRLAKQAKRLGVELFVLDDGWFGKRNNDNAALGDYDVNRKKLPYGLDGLAKRINRLGMKFGLWFEPEMISPDSDLYRAHPEYAVAVPGRKPRLGRNQMVLDLCRSEVRDYIVDSIGRVLDSANVEYVKWDMNRHISDAFSGVLERQGEFYHRYILGLYDVLTRVFSPRPRILLESCSSGGNRFDLGILRFSPQVWVSDDTDPIERLKIQGGLSLFYPQSCFGAHVSMSPHMQTLRATPLSTRFNVAAFGCLGYELEMKFLPRLEKRDIKQQIEYYKRHRRTLQYGKFLRHDPMKDGKVHWQVIGDNESIAGFFQTHADACESYDFLPLRGLDERARYSVVSNPQSIPVSRFGGLVRFLLPFELNPNGFILRTANKLVSMPDGQFSHEASGAALCKGLPLNEQFLGTGYSPNLRLLGDFGSTLYTIKRI